MLFMGQGMVKSNHGGLELSPMIMMGQSSLLENSELWLEGGDMLISSPAW